MCPGLGVLVQAPQLESDLWDIRTLKTASNRIQMAARPKSFKEEHPLGERPVFCGLDGMSVVGRHVLVVSGRLSFVWRNDALSAPQRSDRLRQLASATSTLTEFQ